MFKDMHLFKMGCIVYIIYYLLFSMIILFIGSYLLNLT